MMSLVPEADMQTQPLLPEALLAIDSEVRIT